MFVRFILVIYVIFSFNAKQLLAQNNSESNNSIKKNVNIVKQKILLNVRSYT